MAITQRTKKYFRLTGGPGEGGFTLAEVLVSLTLIGLVLAVMSEFLYSGVSFYARSSQAYQRQHDLNFIYQTLQNELDNLCSNPFLPEDAFEGNGETMTFWRESPTGLYQITYRYDVSNRQLMYGRNFFGGLPLEKVIFTDIEAWQFEYFDPFAKNWAPVWNPSQKNDIPSLVRVSLSTQAGKLGELVFSIKPDTIGERR